MISRRQFLIGTAALVAAPRVSRADSPGRITVAYHDHPDDLWYQSPSGETMGVASEILEAIVTRRAGYPLGYVGLPWLRAQQAVQSGDADALFTIPNDARRSYMRFTPSPLVRYPFAIVYLAESPNAAALAEAQTLDDLRHYTYVYNQFDMTHTMRAATFALSEASPGDAPMLRQVAGGRGDFTIANAIRIHRALETAGLTDRMKVRPMPALGQIEHHFGLRLTYPDADAAIARIEAATQAATAAGDVQAILARHV